MQSAAYPGSLKEFGGHYHQAGKIHVMLMFLRGSHLGRWYVAGMGVLLLEKGAKVWVLKEEWDFG